MKKGKYYLYNAAMLVTALSVSGCSDSEDIPGGNSENPVSKGDAIVFATEDIRSRSIYGDATPEGYPLYWVDGDKITIHSMDAIVGNVGTTTPNDTHEAKYIVKRANDDDSHGTINAEDETSQMLWKDATSDHTFYAVYPTQRFKSVENGKITMQYHTNQVCNVVSGQDGQYETAPDMRNAYMMAKNKVNPNDAKHVILHFDPIMTTLDLTITAGKYEVGTGIIQPITVTGVSVIMPKYLVNGEFSYDMSGEGDTANGHADGWALKSNTVEVGTESVFVGVVDDRESSSKHYLDLFEGETLKLMAFLPPMDVDKYQIKVHTTSGYDFIKTVKSSDLGGSINKRSRINITLPNIYPDGVEYIGGANTQAKSGNNWMSYLPDDVDLKKLSIPAVKITKGNGESNQQKADEIRHYLNMGVRGFDIDDLSEWQTTYTAFPDEIVNEFKNFLADDNHKKETIILWCTNKTTLHTPAEWKDWVAKLGKARSRVIFQEKHTILGQHFFTKYGASSINESNRNCPWDEEFPTVVNSTAAWGCHILKSNNNMENFNSLFVKSQPDDELYQNGFAGIVVIPDADKPYDYVNGVYTYSDLLIQGIIDCNYKFNFRSNK